MGEHEGTKETPIGLCDRTVAGVEATKIAKRPSSLKCVPIFGQSPLGAHSSSGYRLDHPDPNQTRLHAIGQHPSIFGLAASCMAGTGRTHSVLASSRS